MNRIPKEVYQRNARLAKCYYFWLKQRRDIERDILYASAGPGDGMPRGGGNGDPTAAKAEKLIARLGEVDRKIHALQEAMDAMPDEDARVLIRKNLYDHIPLQYIPVNMSESTMKRTRALYIRLVAEKMGEA